MNDKYDSTLDIEKTVLHYKIIIIDGFGLYLMEVRTCSNTLLLLVIINSIKQYKVANSSTFFWHRLWLQTTYLTDTANPNTNWLNGYSRFTKILLRSGEVWTIFEVVFINNPLLIQEYFEVSDVDTTRRKYRNFEKR